ncbi:MAG: hypothetical protein WBG81_02980 [Rhodanobacter sp.]|uniref:hypothetical protein n=1 Tax=Rhodanobacter sp. KK11 TaxID=3083255 RepID=UPI002966B88B|nr:hypothetical protein [Rhodanobacter sp. KK11]MDW2980619.1 hypothetical protein [Rhodanobacter sp. KK11]
MKLIAPCHKCAVPSSPAVMMTGELDNDLLAICVCPNGHRHLVHQAHSAPEVVYSAGIRAFLAGFYSESVVTLTAALERGYELFVKVFLRASGGAATDVDQFWKELRSSSERQVGAFCVIYFFATGMPWKTSTKQAEFRNKVAHRGYIATHEEAHGYGEYVTTSLDAIMSYIKSHNRDAFYQHLEASRAVVYRKAEEKSRNDPSLELCFAGSSALEWNNAGHPEPTFEDALLATSAYLKQFTDGV